MQLHSRKHKYGAPMSGTAHKRPITNQLGIAAAVTAAVGLAWLALTGLSRHHLPHSLPATADALNDYSGHRLPAKVDDQLVFKIVEQCFQQAESIIAYVPGAKYSPAVSFAGRPKSTVEQMLATRCPAVVIPLSEDDRTIGLCTDAALYVYMMGAWIVPSGPAREQVIRDCLQPVDPKQSAYRSRTEAVLFLEPLYELWLDWLELDPQLVAAYAPNFEHVFKYDEEAHVRMQLVLCKVHRCKELFERYLKDIGNKAPVIYTGQHGQQCSWGCGAPAVAKLQWRAHTWTNSQQQSIT